MNVSQSSQNLQLATRNLQLPSHGFLILDKPLGITSAKAVAQVKKVLGCKKIGHGGTLDPLASGVLPLAIGEATKAFDYVASSVKEYRFTVTFGQSRDTDDSEGVVTATTPAIPTREEILKALPDFIGTILQVPPVYSALKIDGERAYKMARAGEVVEMKARPVEIYELSCCSPLEGEQAKQGGAEGEPWGVKESIIPPTEALRASTPPQGGSKVREATFLVTCGRGTYVRSLARDIAIKCNSLGYVSMLRRTRVGKFSETQAISLDKLPEFVHNAALFEAWVPIELALDDIPAINADPEQTRRLRHGQAVSSQKPDGRYMVLHQGRIVALAESRQGTLRPLRIFNL